MDWVDRYLDRLRVGRMEPGPRPPQRRVKGTVETYETIVHHGDSVSTEPPYEYSSWTYEVPEVLDVEVWLDEQDRLHRKDGPAAGGHWFWHGVEVPADVVTAPERITVDRIHAEDDERVRAVLRERYGVLRYLGDAGAELVDVDTVPVEAAAPSGVHLTRALVETPLGERYLVATDGSSTRLYAMRVPDACDTCREAAKALSEAIVDRNTIVEA